MEDKEIKVIKPLSIAREEFVTSLTNLINGSNLPMFILEGIFKDMYSDLKILSKKELERDIEYYNKQMNTETENND